MRCLIKSGLLVVLFASMIGSSLDASAQAKKRTKRTPAKTTKPAASSNPFGGANTGGDPFGGSNTGGSTDPFGAPAKNNAKPSGGGDPFSGGGGDPFSGGAARGGAARKDTGIRRKGNVPIEVIKSASADNPLSDSMPVFLRPDYAVDDNATKVRDRSPLAYEHLREDDAVFRHKIWRIIDAREKINQTFSYPATEENGSQLFFAILYHAVMDSSNGITAFADEFFTKPLSRQEFKMRTSGGVDTSDVFDLDGETILRREVRTREFPVDSVYEFQIKEEVIFDREASRLFTRIIGIAPMAPVIINGKTYPGPHQPVFWLYYPEIRNVLSKFKAYNPKNNGARITWEDLFESRYFSSYIVKSTLDNPFNKTLAQMQSDKLFQLYEGENIRERIFNYEQNLWSY